MSSPILINFYYSGRTLNSLCLYLLLKLFGRRAGLCASSLEQFFPTGVLEKIV